MRKTSIIFIATVIGTILSIHSFDLAHWFIKIKGRGLFPFYYLKYYFAFYLNYSIIIMMEVFYWHVIFLIKIRLSLLNKDLNKIKEKVKFKDGNYFLEKIVGKLYMDKFSNSTGLQTGRSTGITNTIKSGENAELGEYIKQKVFQRSPKFLQ